MRLTFKLTAALLLVVIVLTTIEAFVAVQRQISLFQSAFEEDLRVFSASLDIRNLDDVYSSGGSEAMEALARRINERQTVIAAKWILGDASTLDPKLSAEDMRTFREEGSVIVVEPAAGGSGDSKDGEFVLYRPVKKDGATEGIFRLSESSKLMREFIRGTIITKFFLSFAVITLSGLLMFSVGRMMVGRPIETLIKKARQVAARDFSGVLEWSGTDEIAQLMHEMNMMSEQLSQSLRKAEHESLKRIEALEQLRHSDRLASLGKLAAGIAHELGTPLNVVSGRASMISSGSLPTAETVNSAQVIKGQSERMTKLIQQFLQLARPSAPHRTPTRLGSTVQATVDVFRPLADNKRVSLAVHDESGEKLVKVDSYQMQQVITNLLLNALQATPEGGSIEVELKSPVYSAAHVASAPIKCFALSVRDTGIGIDPEHVKFIFDPFFTTKGIGEGTGLGLSICHGIVKEHGGWISVESEIGKGSCFTVCIPEENADERQSAYH